ncbi:MAG: hypothetical protein GY851_17535 [bacterium]|nr:hypothetical protein [bacterium]
MSDDSLQRQVERWFDGESPEPDDAALRAALARPEAQSHLDDLRRMRDAMDAVSEPRTIEDAQFPTFMADIREGIERPRHQHRGVWALASVTAAALIVAVSAYLVFSGHGTGDPDTVVRAAESEIENAEVRTYSGDDGTATVWVSVPEKDMQ